MMNKLLYVMHMKITFLKKCATIWAGEAEIELTEK